jgi:hypothetical protein
MPSVTPSTVCGRVVFRCDGDEQIGAGHVARCVPLAQAFVALGWQVSFVGAYEGLAAWLLARAGMTAQPPNREAPCGIATGECDAAVLDSYVIAPAAICDLARTLPVVTMAEANRCPGHGILLDYHLDRSEHPDARLLAGPSFAPLDPLDIVSEGPGSYSWVTAAPAVLTAKERVISDAARRGTSATTVRRRGRGVVVTCLASSVPLLDLRAGRPADLAHHTRGAESEALGAGARLALGVPGDHAGGVRRDDELQPAALAGCEHAGARQAREELTTVDGGVGKN